jgi:hypothetical protein
MKTPLITLIMLDVNGTRTDIHAKATRLVAGRVVGSAGCLGFPLRLRLRSFACRAKLSFVSS